MKLEDQVASLDLCKRLKELGVKQEGEFRWVHLTQEKPKWEKWIVCSFQHCGYHGGNYTEWFAAFSVAELGDLLPMEPKDQTYFECTRMVFKKWIVQYRHRRRIIAHQMGDNEADARAQMLIYLIEQKLVKP